VSGAEAVGVDRVMALRLPYFVAAAALFVVFLWAAPQLTTEKIEAARAEGVAVKESHSLDERTQGSTPRPASFRRR